MVQNGTTRAVVLVECVKLASALDDFSRCQKMGCFSFSFSSRWHHSALKGPYALRPVSQQSPQGCACSRNSATICLVEHRSVSTSEGGMSTVSFLHSSFLQSISAVMFWPVHVQKVPQASESLCPAKLQIRCDIGYDGLWVPVRSGKLVTRAKHSPEQKLCRLLA